VQEHPSQSEDRYYSAIPAQDPSLTIIIPPDAPESTISGVFVGIRVSTKPVLTSQNRPPGMFIPRGPKSPVKTADRRSDLGLSWLLGVRVGRKQGLRGEHGCPLLTTPLLGGTMIVTCHYQHRIDGGDTKHTE